MEYLLGKEISLLIKQRLKDEIATLEVKPSLVV